MVCLCESLLVCAFKCMYAFVCVCVFLAVCICASIWVYVYVYEILCVRVCV